MHIHPLEVARQLTIIEHELFRKIKPWEFLGQRFSRADKAIKAPGIMAMIRRFNDVCDLYVCCSLILEGIKMGGYSNYYCKGQERTHAYLGSIY